MSDDAVNKQGQRDYSRRHFLKMSALTAAAVALSKKLADTKTFAHENSITVPAFDTSNSPSLTLPKATYYDKTLAGICGHIAGVLTAYEFASTTPLPDSWFDPMNGPYAGNFSNWSPPSTQGYVIYQGQGQISSNDDWHVDFFNQLIMSDHGINPAFQDIKDEWLAHDISDWGGGYEANREIQNNNMLPPLTGLAEFNRWYWVTEAFIETETVGCTAPGMPITARDLNQKFAQVSGEFDQLAWARFLATAYSLAYFETDARNAIQKASVVLPRNSWPYAVYQKVMKLYAQNPNDWRWAINQMLQFKRFMSNAANDNPEVIPDMINAQTMIAIMYGGNDYNTTFKISALTGNEAIDSASAAMGIMGIVKGTAGTPQIVLDRIYNNGAGYMINDFNRTPHIINNYPSTTLFTDFAKLYQSNAEKVIQAQSGSIDSTNYYVNLQTLQPEVVVPINNYDFEQGSLSGWTTWTPVPDSTSNPHAYAENNSDTAHSGAWKGTVFTDSTVNEVKLYVTLNGLENGATYEAYAFFMTNGEARLFVDNYGGSYIYTSVIESYSNTNYEWVSRKLEFTVSGSSAIVGIHLPANSSCWGNIDNLFVRKIYNPAKTRYEAEKAAISGGQVRSSSNASNGSYVGGLNNIGSYVQFNVNAPSAGEYRMCVNYANGWSSTSQLSLYVNNSQKAIITFPRTAAWGTFSRNIMPVPVVLQSGSNTIKLQRDYDVGYVELDYIELSSYPTAIYATENPNLVNNSSFETGNLSSWGVWPGRNGTDAAACYVETGGYDGTYRCTHYKNTSNGTYEVYTSQVITNLANGTYALRAWAVGGGGQISAFMSAKAYGSNVPELKANVPGLAWPNWTELILLVPVTNGQCEVGFYSYANSQNWLSFDDVRFYRVW